MPEIVNCPQCDRKLRVPDELIGQSVKCPTCGVTFTATAVGSAPPPAPPPPPPPPAEPDVLQRRYEESGAPPPPPPPSDPWGGGGYKDSGRGAFDEYGDGRSSRAAMRGPALSEVSGPATALLVVAILDIVLNGLFMLIAVGGMAAAAEPAKGAAADAAQSPLQADFNQVQRRRPGGGGVGGGGGGGFNNNGPMAENLAVNCVTTVIHIAMQILIIVGAMKMKRLESYGMAMTACILSVIPCFCSSCVILGLPFGIWGLVVLNKPEVKEAFYR